MKRQLAAILAADIVDYSRMMGEDEIGTLGALRRYRSEVFEPTVAGHRGDIVKKLGDGWLVTFASTVDAVDCALRLQDRLVNEDKLRVRIGVHVGDITIDDEDIFGDGVNVAARLESIARPGSVAISDSVYGMLDTTLNSSFAFLGERTLKNIAQPIRIWIREIKSDLPVASVSVSDSVVFPKLVIRPVECTDERREVNGIALAMTSDLSIMTSHSHWLSVDISGETAHGAYEICGRLRSNGDVLRLETEVIGPNGERIWSDRTDGALSDGFDWHDKTVSNVAGGAYGSIMQAERRQFAQLDPVRCSAEECFLGAMLVVTTDAQDALKAAQLVERAVELNPEYGRAYAFGAARVATTAMGHGSSLAFPINDWVGKFRNWRMRAYELLPSDDPERVPILIGDPDRGSNHGDLRSAINHALRMHPFSQDALIFGGWGLVILGEPGRAIPCLDKGETLVADDLLAVLPKLLRTIALVMLGRDEEALENGRAAVALRPNNPAAHRHLAAAAAHLGLIEEAKASVAAVLRIAPDSTARGLTKSFGYAETEGLERYFSGLKLAGFPE